VEAAIASYGATLVSLSVPGRGGEFADVVLGYDRLSGYLADPGTYFGATIGRTAAPGEGRFHDRRPEIPGHAQLRRGCASCGNRGFDKVVWAARSSPKRTGAA